PVRLQTPGGSISNALAAVPNLTIERVNGCDPIASLEVMRSGVSRMRAREGARVLVPPTVIRPSSHAQSDDEKLYRTEAERAEDARRDPVTAFAAWLGAERHATPEFLTEARADADAEVDRAADEALTEPKPEASSIYTH